MMQVENDLDKSQEELGAARTQLEEKEKKVQEVRITFSLNQFLAIMLLFYIYVFRSYVRSHRVLTVLHTVVLICRCYDF